MRPSATEKESTWSKKGLDLWWRLGVANTWPRWGARRGPCQAVGYVANHLVYSRGCVALLGRGERLVGWHREVGPAKGWPWPSQELPSSRSNSCRAGHVRQALLGMSTAPPTCVSISFSSCRCGSSSKFLHSRAQAHSRPDGARPRRYAAWAERAGTASDARRALACHDHRRQRTRAARAQAGAGHPGKQARQQVKQAGGIKTAPPSVAHALVEGEDGAGALEVVAAQLQLLQRVHCGWQRRRIRTGQ